MLATCSTQLEFLYGSIKLGDCKCVAPECRLPVSSLWQKPLLFWLMWVTGVLFLNWSVGCYWARLCVSSSSCLVIVNSWAPAPLSWGFFVAMLSKHMVAVCNWGACESRLPADRLLHRSLTLITAHHCFLPVTLNRVGCQFACLHLKQRLWWAQIGVSTPWQWFICYYVSSNPLPLWRAGGEGLWTSTSFF